MGKAAQPAGETQVAAGAASSDEALRAIARPDLKEHEVETTGETKAAARKRDKGQ